MEKISIFDSCQKFILHLIKEVSVFLWNSTIYKNITHIWSYYISNSVFVLLWLWFLFIKLNFGWENLINENLIFIFNIKTISFGMMYILSLFTIIMHTLSLYIIEMTAFNAINGSKKDSNRVESRTLASHFATCLWYANSAVSLTHSYFYNDHDEHHRAPRFSKKIILSHGGLRWVTLSVFSAPISRAFASTSWRLIVEWALSSSRGDRRWWCNAINNGGDRRRGAAVIIRLS